MTSSKSKIDSVEGRGSGAVVHSSVDAESTASSAGTSRAGTSDAPEQAAPASDHAKPVSVADGAHGDHAPAPNLVRPYTLTAGRTRSSVYLPLEAPVHTTSSVVPGNWPPSDARSRIVTLCSEGPSVAEISARLKLPLGVTRVLVGDLVESGTLRVSVTLDDDATADERRELIGRTLRGLRAL